MNIVNICPTCKETISATPLVEIVVTYQEDLTRAEIYEQGWHKRCYQPALLAVLTEGIGIPAYEDFASDLETIANQLEWKGLPVYAEKIRAKAQAIRAAIAEAKGEAAAKEEPYLASYDYAGDMRDEDVQGF